MGPDAAIVGVLQIVEHDASFICGIAVVLVIHQGDLESLLRGHLLHQGVGLSSKS